MGLSLCWTTTPKGVLLVKLIEPPLAEPHERWCERSKIPLKEEFSPTRFKLVYNTVFATKFLVNINLLVQKHVCI